MSFMMLKCHVLILKHLIFQDLRINPAFLLFSPVPYCCQCHCSVFTFLLVQPPLCECQFIFLRVTSFQRLTETLVFVLVPVVSISVMLF